MLAGIVAAFVIAAGAYVVLNEIGFSSAEARSAPDVRLD